jgi:hypothetical protein
MTITHNKILTRFNEIYSAVHEVREQCVADRRFCSVPGAQWEGVLAEQFANKPMLETNKCHLAVKRIISECRNNQVSVEFLSKDGAKNVGLADVCASLYRACEQNSAADEAYTNALEESITGGMGAWRYRADYENDEDPSEDEQTIVIEPIFEADSTVYWDLNSKRQDKSDAMYCYVLTSMTRDAYQDEYDDYPETWIMVDTVSEFDWATPDVVYVAEYYEIERIKEYVEVYSKGSENDVLYREDIDADKDARVKLRAAGWKLAEKKTITTKKVHKYIASGGKILEDCGYIAGKNIPIAPMYGERFFIDGIEWCVGHTRYSKDVQRLKNMQISKLAEISALSSIEKPILTPEQIVGHQSMWEEDNIRNYPYLLLNPVVLSGVESLSGPIGYTKPPQIPPAIAALMSVAEQDIQDILGNPQNAEQVMPTLSGRAVELVQNRIDMQSFIYFSNRAKAMKRGGEIWLSMARDIFMKEGRKLKTLDSEGESRMIEIMRPIEDEKGWIIFENDLSRANFDVAVTVGPSSSSRKSATVRDLTAMVGLAKDPETAQVLMSMAMMNMEGEGVSEVRDYFRKKLVSIGAVKPTEEEQRVMDSAPKQPDPNAELMAAMAAEAQSKAQKASSEILLNVAKTDETRAKAEKLQAELGHAEETHTMGILNMLRPA